jgi:protein TonB
MTAIDPIAFAPATATDGRRFGIVLAAVCMLHAGVLTALALRSPAPPVHEPAPILTAALIAPLPMPVESVSRAVAAANRPVKEPLRRPPAASRTRRLTPAPPIQPAQSQLLAPVATTASPLARAVNAFPARAESDQGAPPASGPPAAESLPTATALSRLDCTIAKPAYPALSRRLRETGTTVVQLVIDEHGIVESTHVVKSSGYPRLDDAASQAVLASTCSPYLKDGTPKRASAAVPFTFSLDN